MPKDLRYYLSQLEQSMPDEYVRIERAVWVALAPRRESGRRWVRSPGGVTLAGCAPRKCRWDSELR